MSDKDIPSYQPTPKVQPQGKIERPAKQTVRMSANQIAYHALRSSGVSKSQAAKQLGLSSGYGTITEQRCKVSYEDEIAKLAPVSLKNLKKLINAEPYGSMDIVKDSTALAAIKEVTDRVSPKKTITESNNLHTFIEVKVDMERYKQGKVVDAQVKELESHK